MEPVRATMISKKSKQGVLKSLLPDIAKLKNKYQLAFDLKGNRGIIAIQSVIQKWIDQGISANHYYDFTKYPDNDIPLSEIAKDILYFYQMGGKQIYYSNTYDGKTDDFEEMLKDTPVDDCAGGACSI
jgi:ribonucleoside-diphosphate reductase alpha chain